MLNHLALKLSLPLVLLCLVAADSDAPGKEVVDKSGKVAVTLGDAWQSLPKTPAANPKVLLAMKYSGGPRGKLAPIFMVALTTTRVPLDAAAQAIVDLARKTVPDQGDAGTIVPGKLDGEESRVIVTRSLLGGKPIERKQVLARHGGQGYLFDLFCDDDQFAAFVPTADAALATVRWK